MGFNGVLCDLVSQVGTYITPLIVGFVVDLSLATNVEKLRHHTGGTPPSGHYNLINGYLWLI